MKGRGFLVGVCVAVVAAIAAPGAFAATLRVDDDQVQCPTAAYTSIQAAVTAASANDTVIVCAGNYPESVTVTKKLTIRGNRDHPDLLSCNGTRTDVTNSSGATTKAVVVEPPPGSFGFDLQANNITLQGFTIQGSDQAGVYTSPSFSGYTIRQNLFQDNTIGLYFHSSGGVQSRATVNCFRENNNPGAAAGNAIYSDQGIAKAMIQGNRFFNNENAAVLLTHVDGVTPRPTNVSVKGNLMLNDPTNATAAYSFAIIVHSTGSEISGNILKNGTEWGSAIFVGPGNSGLKIKGNIIQTDTPQDPGRAWYRGIHVKADEVNFGVFGPSTSLDISGNIVNGMVADGLRVAPDSMTGSKVKGNIFQGNGDDGIKVNSAQFCTSTGDPNDCDEATNPGGTPTTPDNFGNTFHGNVATGNGTHDCHDATNGSGTGGTANTWKGNIGHKVNRTGICFPGNQVVPPFEHDPFP